MEKRRIISLETKARVRQARRTYAINSRELLLADMRTTRVPITPPNVLACSGHSRAWMRLYALRLLHPLLCEAGEPENAVTSNQVTMLRYR